MGFNEKTIGSGSQGGAGQRRYEFALAGASTVPGPWELHTVRGVKNDRAPVLPHQGEGSHVDNEVLIAESCSALGLPYFGCANAPEFFRDMRRSEEHTSELQS